MIFRPVLCAIILMGVSVAPQLMAQAPQFENGIERSSADDCAIFVLAGKKLLAWGEEYPKYSLGVLGYSQNGRQMYVLDCPWKELGVVAPEIRANDDRVYRDNRLSRVVPLSSRSLTNLRSTMTRPRYGTPGVTATNYVEIGKSGGTPVEIAAWQCSYAKFAETWNLLSCEPVSVCTTGVFFGKPPKDAPCTPVSPPKLLGDLQRD